MGWDCPVHGGFGNLNCCAWPGCPHGIDADHADVDDMLGGTDRFFRVSWTSPEGDEFHDWQTDRWPNWFSLSRVYSYFMRKITASERVTQMFHYTSVEGALAILQSGTLRFTDYAYLNDTREITYGLDVIRSTLDSRDDLTGSPGLRELKAELERDDPYARYNIYTASFSSASDSLSQFRLYGPVALGFESNPIGFGSFKGDTHLDHVVYDPEMQTQLIELFFSLVEQSEAKDAPMIAQDAKSRLSQSMLVADLLRIVACFKHPAFADEKEIRLLYSEPLEILDKAGQDCAQRKFRASGGLIVPFTDTASMTRRSNSEAGKPDKPQLPLTSVVIGPVAQAETLAKGMSDLLSDLGYHDVEVILSEAPLRA